MEGSKNSPECAATASVTLINPYKKASAGRAKTTTTQHSSNRDASSASSSSCAFYSSSSSSYHRFQNVESVNIHPYKATQCLRSDQHLVVSAAHLRLDEDSEHPTAALSQESSLTLITIDDNSHEETDFDPYNAISPKRGDTGIGQLVASPDRMHPTLHSPSKTTPIATTILNPYAKTKKTDYAFQVNCNTDKTPSENQQSQITDHPVNAQQPGKNISSLVLSSPPPHSSPQSPRLPPEMLVPDNDPLQTPFIERKRTATLSATEIVNPYRKKQLQTLEGHLTNEQGEPPRPPHLEKLFQRTKMKEILSSIANTPLPQNMDIFEKFFASLLQVPAWVHFESAVQKDDWLSRQVWSTICQRLCLAIPPSPIQDQYDSAPAHFRNRATLVLEEARHSISHGLSSRWRSEYQEQGLSKSLMGTIEPIRARASSGWKDRFQCATVTFGSDTPFTHDQMDYIRPGTVYECCPCFAARSIANSVLSVATGFSRRDGKIDHPVFSFHMMVFVRELPSLLKKDKYTKFKLYPIAILNTELRSFEALMIDPEKVAFIDELMGKGRAVVRTDEQNAAEKPVSLDENDEAIRQRLRPLNPAQNEAAKAFLDSPENSITLVQGPPGTGESIGFSEFL